MPISSEFQVTCSKIQGSINTPSLVVKSYFDCSYCFIVIFFIFQGKFPEAPIVLVTSEHLRTGKEYDAALIWIEDVTKDSVKVCLREMQNFDGRHQDITVVRY